MGKKKKGPAVVAVFDAKSKHEFVHGFRKRRAERKKNLEHRSELKQKETRRLQKRAKRDAIKAVLAEHHICGRSDAAAAEKASKNVSQSTQRFEDADRSIEVTTTTPKSGR